MVGVVRLLVVVVVGRTEPSRLSGGSNSSSSSSSIPRKCNIYLATGTRAACRFPIRSPSRDPSQRTVPRVWHRTESRARLSQFRFRWRSRAAC